MRRTDGRAAGSPEPRPERNLEIRGAIMTYKPFIIVGMPRTGSNLLFTTLQQHRAIAAYSELFHPLIGERSGRHAIRRDGAALYFDPSADPLGFLRCWVWTEEAARYRAVGFKIFPEYLRSESTRRLLERLRDEVPGLHVLHIRRANYFDVFVSRLVADKTGSWITYREDVASGDPLANTRLVISPETAERFFRAMKWADAYLESLFVGIPCLRVDYARLARDVQSEATAVFDYLAVGTIPVDPAIRKQLTVPKRDLVSNYDELARHFSGTPYEWFFAAEGDAAASAAAARTGEDFHARPDDGVPAGKPSWDSLDWLDDQVASAVKGGLVPGQPPEPAADVHIFRRAEPDVLETRPRSTAARAHLEAVNGAPVAARADLTLWAGTSASFGGWSCRTDALEVAGDIRYFFLQGRDPPVRYYARVDSRIQRDDVAAAVKLPASIARFSGFDFVADLQQVPPGRYRLGVAHEAGNGRYEFVFKHRVIVI